MGPAGISGYFSTFEFWLEISCVCSTCLVDYIYEKKLNCPHLIFLTIDPQTRPFQYNACASLTSFGGRRTWVFYIHFSISLEVLDIQFSNFTDDKMKKGTTHSPHEKLIPHPKTKMLFAKEGGNISNLLARFWATFSLQQRCTWKFAGETLYANF